MKRIFANNTMKLTLAIGALWWLTSCGSSKSSGGGFDSASTDGSVIASDAAIATCSSDVAALADFQVQVMQYGSETVSNKPDLVRVKIVKAPQEYIAEDWEVLMYRWTVADDGTNQAIDNDPLYFQFERKDTYSTFQQMTSSTAPVSYQAFYGGQVQQMVDYANQFTSYSPLSASSATGFFQKATFLVNLRDLKSAYQVIRIVLKKSGTVMREVDVLIPSFQADPALYNADSRHPTALQQLHPLKSKLGGTWTKDQYSEFARSSCF